MAFTNSTKSRYEFWLNKGGNGLDILVNGIPYFSFNLYEDGTFSINLSNTADAINAETIQQNGKRITEEEFVGLLDDKRVQKTLEFIESEGKIFSQRMNEIIEMMHKNGNLPEYIRKKEQEGMPPNDVGDKDELNQVDATNIINYNDTTGTININEP